MKKFLLAGLAVVGLGFSSVAPANAAIVLNFAGLNGDSEESPLNFYNGGTGSLGSGPGPNFGITFPSNSLTCDGKPGGFCNSAEIPGGPGANLLFFVNGASDQMNVAAGFTTGFSFFYSSPFTLGTVDVWSGLNGTGTLLAALSLALTPDSGNPGCLGTSFCPYVAFGVTFAGTAHSVDFAGTANGIAFADITIGSATAGGGSVPEPASLALFGAGLLGLGLLRRFRAS